MESLVRDSLQDAFLPKMLRVYETTEKADAAYTETVSDLFWQSKYRDVSEPIIFEKYDGVLPLVTQYQMDSSTLVSCLKVDARVSFDPVFHYEGKEVDAPKDDVQKASNIFFGLSSERDTPSIKKWDDMRWNEIGIVPKDNFYLFVRILLHRLTPIVEKRWKHTTGYVSAHGFDQDIVKCTYFDVLKDRFSVTSEGADDNETPSRNLV